MRDGISLAWGTTTLWWSDEWRSQDISADSWNNDELRPTGGLVHCCWTLLMQNGRISDLNLRMKILVETQTVNLWLTGQNHIRPLPGSSNSNMNSRVLLLRDTSWFTNYPTAALYAGNFNFLCQRLFRQWGDRIWPSNFWWRSWKPPDRYRFQMYPMRSTRKMLLHICFGQGAFCNWPGFAHLE